jgi:uncharacterized protein
MPTKSTPLRKKTIKIKNPSFAVVQTPKPFGVRQVLGYHFLKQLKSLPYIDHIFLFGSRAKGNNDERSDIDLAIDCPKATDQQWNQVMKIIENSDTLLKIDCVRYDHIKNRIFLNAILKNHYVL